MWCSTSDAEEVTLVWDPNTEADLAGYKIHVGAATRNYTRIEDVQLPDPTRYIVTGLNQGETYYFAATAYDISNNESDYSNEVVYTIPIPDTTPPDAPKGFKRVVVIVNLDTGEIMVKIKEGGKPYEFEG